MKNVIKLFAAFMIAASFSSCGYNSMVDKGESVDEAWAKVQSQYQRRSDLIGNLVETVKQYADFEKSTLKEVIEARAKASSTTIDASKLTPEALKQFQANQDQLSSSLGRLLVTVERYPDLKAGQNFKELQDELTGTENRIATARNRFNESVKNYNAYIKKFPRMIYAGWFGFDPKPYFEADQGTDKAPSVKDLFE
jgi:LemA protein